MTSVDKHNNSLRKLFGYLLPVIITFLFLYFAFRGIDLKQSFGLIAKTSLLWLAVYLIVFFLSHFFRAMRWKVMIKPVKPNSSTLNLFGALMIGYGVNCVIPRLGELYRGMFLGKWENISRTTMLGTVVVERIIDIATFAIASLISVYLYSGDLFKDITWLKPSLMIGFIVIFVLILFLVVLVRFKQGFTSVILKFTDRINPKISIKLSEVFSTLIDGLSSIKGAMNIFNIIMLTVLIFIFYALNSYVGFYMLGMEKMGDVNLSMAWVFMAISAYGVFIPTPGGTGSYHLISIFVLSDLYNFSYESSAAYAILSHFIQYFVFIITTVVMIYWINKKRERAGASKENFLSVFNNRKDYK